MSVLSNGDVVSNSKVFDGVVLFLLNFGLNFIAFFYFCTFSVKKAEYMRAYLFIRATRDGKNWRT